MQDPNPILHFYLILLLLCSIMWNSDFAIRLEPYGWGLLFIKLRSMEGISQRSWLNWLSDNPRSCSVYQTAAAI